MVEDDAQALAERFLDLWQENVRLWASDRDILTAGELAELLGEPAGPRSASDD